MNDERKLSRRRFLQSTGAAGGTAYLRIVGPSLIAITESACSAKQASERFKVLGDQEAADFAAIAARLIPATDTPGATEAGVIYFFDNAFADAMSAGLESARAGLAAFKAALAEVHPGATSLTDISTDEQDAFLKKQEGDAFFEMVLFMTILGFFSMEKYGGNKDHIGWDLIGFDGHHGAWQYPFGYYDAQVHGEAADGE